MVSSDRLCPSVSDIKDDDAQNGNPAIPGSGPLYKNDTRLSGEPVLRHVAPLDLHDVVARPGGELVESRLEGRILVNHSHVAP